MTTISRTLLFRIACILVATAALWILVAGWASMPALGLGIVATIALAVSFLADLISLPSNDSIPTPSAPRTMLGDASDILGLIDDAVLSYDHTFKITFANTAASELFGIASSDLLGTVVTPKLLQEKPTYTHLVQVIYPSLAPTVVPRSSQVVDLSFEDPELHLTVTTMPLGGDHGFLKIVRDRTRQVSLVRSKSEFVTVASHQLRTPLTEVSWALETLASSTTAGPDDKALATQTLDSVRSLIRTAEDLLGVAKIEEGRFGYRFAMQDVVALLDAELSKALPVVEASGIKLFFDRPTVALPPVFIDKDKISMVINNLIENAIRYNVKNGEITLRAEASATEPFVKISVQDTGIGIAEADVAKLFTKFFRAENAVRAVAGGTGLGLYIVNNIVRAHGGQLGVASELGRGSTFYFTLATDERRVPQREVAESFS